MMKIAYDSLINFHFVKQSLYQAKQLITFGKRQVLPPYLHDNLIHIDIPNRISLLLLA